MPSSYSLYRCAVLSTSSGSLAEFLDRDSPIQILPLRVNMGPRQVADGIDIDNHTYCEWRQHNLEAPVSTRQPPCDLLRKSFRHLITQGYQQVIVTTLAGSLSSTADDVRQMAAEFPQLKIHVVDTGLCCMPEGFFAQEAFRLLGKGKTPQQVVDYLERLKPNGHIFFGLQSLQALSVNGTLARLGARFYNWLGLRTILHFSESQLTRLGSVSDDDEMFGAIITQVEQYMGDKNPQNFILSGVYTGSEEVYSRFADRFYEETGLHLGGGVPVSAAVAVHVGIAGVGVGLVEKLKD